MLTRVAKRLASICANHLDSTAFRDTDSGTCGTLVQFIASFNRNPQHDYDKMQHSH